MSDDDDPPGNDPPRSDPPRSDPPRNDPPHNDPPHNDPPRNDPPRNVIPFGNEIGSAIAKLLRQTYEESLSEALPERILALFRQYDEAAKKDSGSKP